MLSITIDMITKISLQNKKSPWVGMRYEDWLARTFLIKNPCVYREHTICIPKWPVKAGLSLCIQGTRNHPHYPEDFERFIPVHTGNTNPVFSWNYGCSVYPCAYREHAISYIPINTQNGLSLCIQGTHTLHHHPCSENRFIPVHTGNTIANSHNGTHYTVYPCAYREHGFSVLLTVGVCGLSLCIQGTLQL